MVKRILDVVPLAQSVALAGHNVEFVDKKDKDVGDFLGHGVKNVVGSKFIGDTSDIIGSF